MHGMATNPLLRDALQTTTTTCSSPTSTTGSPFCSPYALSPIYPNGPPNVNAPIHTIGSDRLPTDLNCEGSSWQPMDVQCDIDAVLRHELNVAGKLEFGNFDNL